MQSSLLLHYLCSSTDYSSRIDNIPKNRNSQLGDWNKSKTMDFAKSLISYCLLITTMLVGLSTPTFDYSASSYTPRVRCSRVCPCYYQSLFCRGYKYYNIPSDTSETIQNIDFTVSTNNPVLLQVSP